jgi:hypothetical protein
MLVSHLGLKIYLSWKILYFMLTLCLTLNYHPFNIGVPPRMPPRFTLNTDFHIKCECSSNILWNLKVFPPQTNSDETSSLKVTNSSM